MKTMTNLTSFFLLSFIFIAISCKGDVPTKSGDEITEFITAVEVTNKVARNTVVDNDKKTISFDLGSEDRKTDVKIRLTLAKGVSMVQPVQAEAVYDLSRGSGGFILSAGGKSVRFTIKAGTYEQTVAVITAVDVTNKTARKIVIDNDNKQITFEILQGEELSDVNLRLTLAEDVSMVSPTDAQATYNLTTPKEIKLLADGSRQISFWIYAKTYIPLPDIHDFLISVYSPPRYDLWATIGLEKLYRQMADAGFNHVWDGAWKHFTEDIQAQALDASERNGMTFMVDLNMSSNAKYDTDPALAASELTRILNLVNRFKDHPAAHFYIIDEPQVQVFDRLAKIHSEIWKILPPDKYVLAANMYGLTDGTKPYGGVSYNEYMTQYMPKVQPRILSFDTYMFYTDPIRDLNMQAVFVQNIIDLRNRSVQYGNIPYWGFIQANGQGNTFREPTLEEYRWQINALIAGGAKAATYFAYDYSSNLGHPGLLDINGYTTNLYDNAKQVNWEIRAYADKVMPFRNDGFIMINTTTDTSLTSRTPSNLKRNSYGSLSNITTSGKMLNGCFIDDNGRKAVLLFNYNKSNDSTMSADLTFNGNVSYELWGKDGLEKEGTATGLSGLSLLPAEAKFLIFK